MVYEQATVLRVEAGIALLSSRQRSACDSCRAQPGCGQAVLARLMRREDAVPALLPSALQGEIKKGSEVTVAIPMHTVVLGSLLIYLLPVFGLLVAAILATAAGAAESIVAASAAVGLVLGGGLVRYVSWLLRSYPGLQPSVVACKGGSAVSCVLLMPDG